ncbi:hypothetical protein OBBRIDRAFT_890805 [Obba rivulosa]|uniref:Origin recognition complex subunit 5 n=1 Tax=Obba rivulosa TaxID=1052685 RepID=A0A8E2AKP2_9APHY|nr:hypothetical protein OBBRIDRAFT_890805 [Obba rivulosa]
MDSTTTDMTPVGYEACTSLLTTLLTSYPPPFMFVYDPETPRLTSSVVRTLVQDLKTRSKTAGSPLKFASAVVNAVACFTRRLFYDTVLNALAEWRPSWEDGCGNWSGSGSMSGQRFNENFDAFVHGLQAIRTLLEHGSDDLTTKTSAKGKGKAKATSNNENETHRLIIVIERAERLKDSLPDLLVPLTRLAELSQLDVITIFVSDVRWADMRPSLGASPDPYYIDIPALSKQNTIEIMTTAFDTMASCSSSSKLVDAEAYSPVLRSLYDQFITTLYSICSPFVHDVYELMYIAAARWPGFILPVLEAHRAYIEELDRLRADGRSHEFDSDHRATEVSAHSDDEMRDHDIAGILYLPTEDTRIRLVRLFTPSFTSALEGLYPRLTHAADWAREHIPPANLLTLPYTQIPAHMSGALGAQTTGGAHRRDIHAFPRTSQFILVAAFLASTNSPKSDMRMFGRGTDERAKRRRRKGGSPRKAREGTGGGGIKIPQRLLGPTPFPVDRLLAILGVLLEEYDAETRPQVPQFAIPGEYTDMEIARVSIHAAIMELASMRLLIRVSSADRVDATPTFKCGISYDIALQLAREIGIVLNDLLWDSV